MYELTTIRTVLSEDGTHDHIEFVGYASTHMPGEPITISPARVIQKMALGEKFWVDVNGEKAEVQAAACEMCGFEPQLKTTADTPGDNKLFRLHRL